MCRRLVNIELVWRKGVVVLRRWLRVSEQKFKSSWNLDSPGGGLPSRWWRAATGICHGVSESQTCLQAPERCTVMELRLSFPC